MVQLVQCAAGGLFNEESLAALQHLAGQRILCPRGRGDKDRLHLRIGQNGVETMNHPHTREALFYQRGQMG